MAEEDAVTVAAAESGDPLAVLHRIREQRRELDRAEAVAVRRARTSGASRAFAATALRVTRQAAHQRYGRR